MQNPTSYWQNNLIDLLKIIVPTVSTLLAGILGYLLSLSHLRRQKNLEFKEKQLREFYSPLVGYLEKIKAKAKLRDEILSASDRAWKQICETHTKPFVDHAKFFEPFKRTIDYENQQLKEQLIPLYDSMLDVFTNNLWLANESTRLFYYDFVKYIDIWHRYLSDSIPFEVLLEIKHSEQNLDPFYKDIRQQLAVLRKELGGSKK